MAKTISKNKGQDPIVCVPQDEVITRSPMSGSASPEFTSVLQSQAVITASGLCQTGDPEANQRKIRAIEGALCGIAPQDEIEGMLAAQMIAVHNASMDSFKMAAAADYKNQLKYELQNQGIKLSRTFGALAHTFTQHRHNKNGKQQVNVERVDVHDGGQAIVGSVTSHQR